MYKNITKMSNQDELNNARFISVEDIESIQQEEEDTNICVASCDVSTIDTDDSFEEEHTMYTEEDLKAAKEFGVSVEELFKIYEEINNFDDGDDYYCNCQEWPSWGPGGYEDEGQLESMYQLI